MTCDLYIDCELKCLVNDPEKIITCMGCPAHHYFYMYVHPFVYIKSILLLILEQNCGLDVTYAKHMDGQLAIPRNGEN